MNKAFTHRKVNYNNYSGCKGVHWDKPRRKWSVKIHINCLSLFLGRYKDFGDAAEVREKAEVAISILRGVDATNIHISTVENGNKIISGILPKNGLDLKFKIEIDLPRTKDYHVYYYESEDIL